jgi:hypothetical protein
MVNCKYQKSLKKDLKRSYSAVKLLIRSLIVLTDLIKLQITLIKLQIYRSKDARQLVFNVVCLVDSTTSNDLKFYI